MDYSDFLQLEKEVPEKATKTKEIEPDTKGYHHQTENI